MLSKSSEYAVRALIFIAVSNNAGVRPGYKKIAQEINSPEQFTAKILQTLTRNRFINSIRGRGGGFFFDKRKPESIRLFDVINLIEGNQFFSRCGIGLNECNSENPCPCHEKYQNIRIDFEKLVKEETILSLSNKVELGEAVLRSV